MTEYSFSLAEEADLVFRYEGEILGRFAYWTDAVIHFSFYNAWYPVFSTVKGCYEVEMALPEGWYPVNGIYDEDRGLWIFRPGETMPGFTDCNILLLKKSHYTVLEQGSVSFCFLSAWRDRIEPYFDLYRSVKDYYLSLYGQDRLGKNAFVYLPENEDWPGDGYRRANLIVSTALPDHWAAQSHLMAHEMGHAYANGADPSGPVRVG